jgi:hypothetical protein
MAAKKKTTKRVGATSIPVIVCTPTRDVWYGHTTDPDATPLVLTGARHCYHWGTQRGLGQLAEIGPGPGHKIGASVTQVRVRAVACVLSCTDAARAALEAASWAH